MTLRLTCAAMLVTIASWSAHAVADTRPAASTRSPATTEAAMRASIEQEGRAQIDDLVRQMQETRDPATRLAIARRIPDVKLDTDLKVLRFRAASARGRGDHVAAQRFEDAISMLLHPVIRARVSTATKAGGR